MAVAARDSASDPAVAGSPEGSFLKFRQQLRTFFARDLRRYGPAAVDDLMQVTYERLRRYRTKGVTDAESYVFEVARNVLRAWWRKSRLEEARFVSCENAELQQHAEGLNSLWIQEDGGPALAEEEFERVLAQLPRACRVALLRQVRDGWSYRQIAQELGVSTHMVKLHIVRALAHFRVHYSLRTDR